MRSFSKTKEVSANYSGTMGKAETVSKNRLGLKNHMNSGNFFRKMFLVFVAAVIVISFCFGLSSCSNNVKERWEYKVYFTRSSATEAQEQEFNTLGKDGWELMFKDGTYYYFKRRIQ